MNKRLKWNNISILVYQILAVLVGLVLPRLILNEYGSQVNGLAYSISQMLSVVSYFVLEFQQLHRLLYMVQ